MALAHIIDLLYLGIPQSIAAYAVMGPQGLVLIETGPASTLKNLSNGLARLGCNLAEIRHALLTHIHLDHAGAAGHLARNGTQIYVHEFGVKHLADPTKLIDSARRIYADQMELLWGTILPVPEEQITPVRDGDVLEFEGLSITAIETPGHARHHHAYKLETEEGSICFTGDIAGIIVPGISEPPTGKYIAVPTPPPEFDVNDWRHSIRRLQAENFSVIYPTHFGPRGNVQAHWERLATLLEENVRLVRDGLAAGRSREQIIADYVEWNLLAAEADGIARKTTLQYATMNLLRMNVDGVIRFWEKHSKSPAVSS